MEEKSAKKENKVLKFFVTLLFVILMGAAGIVGGMYLSDSKNISFFKNKEIKEEEKESTSNEIEEKVEETGNENQEDKVIFTGEYSGKVEFGNGFNDVITLKFFDDGTLSLTSGDGAAMIEYSEGTYSFENDKLIYRRIYALGSSNDTLVRVNDSSSAKFSVDFENSDVIEEFVYDKENDTFETSTYFTKTRNRNEKIILKKNPKYLGFFLYFLTVLKSFLYLFDNCLQLLL